MSESECWTEVRLWLRYAQEDLDAAEELIKSIITPRHVCFLAQQAAEKAIKAVLIFEQISFPRSHDLESLTNLIPTNWTIKTRKPDLSTLTQWVVEARYPGNWPEATKDEARAALDIAREILDLIACDMKARGLDTNL